MNVTHVPYFTLAAYGDIGQLRYVCFVFVLCVYVFIVGANVFLIVVICVNRSLHEPMYMFLCSLFVNELYGSTGLFPLLLVQILSDVHSVPASLCFLQIFCVYMYAGVEFFNLTVMSYDRYVAICHPLQYSTRVTPQRAAALIAVCWSSSCLISVSLISLSAPLPLCGNLINKVYCGYHSVVKLSCSNSSVSNFLGIMISCLSVSVTLALILFSYLRILQVCLSGCKQSRAKALSTCTPHLASLINFSFGCVFEVLQSRFNMSRAPSGLRIFLSLYFLSCQPLFNPLLYGLRMSRIHHSCRRLLAGRK
ncbi:olfactory receptor 11A1-like [Stegastes partitus]|uniref:Olfactory receptor n=1 Tax=Stegastes partitus TaxID=144197 RepID=A0A9Y4NQJ6_9TELE|nr:PREDICTED: olfactory receptor 11A1-like [Stegastes partitus]